MIAASRSQTGSHRDWRTWLAGKIGRKGDKTWSAPRYAAAVLLLFLAGYAGARAFDQWENRISDGEYILYIQQDASAPFAHPGV